MATNAAASPVAANDTQIAEEISDRLSQEIVIAMVGPIGSGVSTAALLLKDILEGQYQYKVAPLLRPSDVIRERAPALGITLPSKQDIAVYVAEMQTAGNRLRERFGGNYLVEKVVERIRQFREQDGGYLVNGGQRTELPGRRAYIIDSLKNPEELALLKSIYRDTLCVVGVFAPDEIRRQRLRDANFAHDAVDSIIQRDAGEVATFGQATRKLFTQADFFVCNDKLRDELEAGLRRFVEIVFDVAIHTPTRAESAMYKADAAAANSACLSRQVGASIVSANGELIAVGWNDVPKFGGGLYVEDDRSQHDPHVNGLIDKDHRCYNWRGGKCHNETRREKLISEVANATLVAGHVAEGRATEVRLSVSDTAIRDLIEFSRSIHAEMEAILAVAREGKHSLVGATLFTTTYPCHNCARHIVAAGITKVFYIEPYLKSLAIELHDDVISEVPGIKNKVTIRQFDGVAPSNYLRLFRVKNPRKSNGILIRPERATAVPVFRVLLDAQQMYEDKVIADIAAKEQSLGIGEKTSAQE
jgi:deoxycytidylate deaminase